MKKRLNFIALIITTMPFAFSKMEGPFVVKKDDIYDLSINTDFLEEISKNPKSTYSYIFIYDKKTGYTIGYVPKEEIPSIHAINFFQGNHTAFNSHIKHIPRFYFTKEKPNLELKDFNELTESKNIAKYVTSSKNSTSPEIISIRLNSSVYTLSGVEIINQRPTLIKQNDKSQSFHESFVNYFKKTNNTKFAKNYSVDKDNKKNLDIVALLKGHHFNPTKTELDLLEHSQILAGYAVLKNPQNKDSIVWGLAKDRDTFKKFHWITDFEDDISVLVDR